MARARSLPLLPRKVFQSRFPLELSFAAKASSAPLKARTGEPQLGVNEPAVKPATKTFPLVSTVTAQPSSLSLPPRKVFQIRLTLESSFAAKASLLLGWGAKGLTGEGDGEGFSQGPQP